MYIIFDKESGFITGYDNGFLGWSMNPYAAKGFDSVQDAIVYCQNMGMVDYVILAVCS